MAKMLGDVRDSGCGFGKKCSCNGYYRTKKFTRIAKRRERQERKRGVLPIRYRPGSLIE